MTHSSFMATSSPVAMFAPSDTQKPQWSNTLGNRTMNEFKKESEQVLSYTWK